MVAKLCEFAFDDCQCFDTCASQFAPSIHEFQRIKNTASNLTSKVKHETSVINLINLMYR